ncbi:hypothetical protein GQ55_2G169400 [Panicum hallii var. hallii]|uniref:Uncharacterized protein n=1 Tax=Panicum hallii var. hallii TaxID=1504633 RepID=A0A2T7EQ30_9POAL|nr:hypothetical protein GQ55_2G169400 [Panicum hallii var. hallii]
MINTKTTFAAVPHNLLHFDVFKLAGVAGVCRIAYAFQLCVCYRLNLSLDGFINDFYEQRIF